ncbi:carbonic anhydrase [Halonotius roseus]|uniref:PadR family transcriptional regulator n=1 Tax=Halonotius roseus TaxID=2511997 RepID=A0A544QKL6_9EURY|nr:carbonic anhydrase [Halonotius roseus]TQQ78909.1 PadR family transcriptional regulator [Halonotius roseus]
MAEDGLESLLTALDIDPDRTPPAAAGEPAVVSIGCPLADCDHDPGWLADMGTAHLAVTTLGNRTWERRDGERELQASIRGAIADRPVAAVVVVGHTDCDVVADAYDRYCGPERSSPAGVRASLAPLEGVVADAVDGDGIDTTGPRQRVQHRLVEYNVVRNVAFLRDRLPSTTVAGVVVDQAGVYDSFPGKEYLVALEDATEPAALRARLPEGCQLSVGRLLSTASIR